MDCGAYIDFFILSTLHYYELLKLADRFSIIIIDLLEIEFIASSVGIIRAVSRV